MERAIYLQCIHRSKIKNTNGKVLQLFLRLRQKVCL